MGIISEFHAENQAQDLEKILMVIVEHYDDEDMECQSVQMFAREHIIPLYNDVLEDTYRSEISENEKKIKDFFA